MFYWYRNLLYTNTNYNYIENKTHVVTVSEVQLKAYDYASHTTIYIEK